MKQLLSTIAIAAIACTTFASAASALPACKTSTSKFVLDRPGQIEALADVIVAEFASKYYTHPQRADIYQNNWVNYYWGITMNPIQTCGVQTAKGVIPWTEYRTSVFDFYVSYWHDDTKDNIRPGLDGVPRVMLAKKSMAYASTINVSGSTSINRPSVSTSGGSTGNNTNHPNGSQSPTATPPTANAVQLCEAERAKMYAENDLEMDAWDIKLDRLNRRYDYYASVCTNVNSVYCMNMKKTLDNDNKELQRLLQAIRERRWQAASLRC